MRRRDFVTFLIGATAWVAEARAQEQRHVIGYLATSDAWPGELEAVYQGLKEIGFVVGKNISIEFRWAEGHYDRLPSFATELVDRNVSVILADGVPSVFAAKAATKTIPIVFVVGADPVKVGLVESFSRPNSNLTGVSILFRVPDRGSGNPTPLGGWDRGASGVDWLDGSVQAWRPYGLGLQVPPCLGDEVSVPSAWR
jgi:putative ABC transport system substrate-binding protein